MRRRKSREFALQILFSLETQSGQDTHLDTERAQSATKEYLQNFAPRGFEEILDVPFLQRLVEGICTDVKAIDQELEKHSEHWKLYRMTRIDRNVLRIGVEELKSFHDVPSKVTLDECVELAKRFGTDDSSAFVNGVLDKVRHALGRAED
ncbi:MAG TPA: transcription antitermination factor NusB [Bdellovibrionota bacterium]|jgi:N utilization substance protein B